MSLQVNRNIIGVLLSYSTKMGRAIDFDRALKVSLLALPLSALQMKMEVTEKKSKSKRWMLLTQREMKTPHKHPVKTIQILSSILLLWFKHWL